MFDEKWAKRIESDPFGQSKLTVADVDERAGGLVDEFREYLQENELNSNGIDRRDVFESWILQKVAALQVVLYKQTAAMQSLHQALTMFKFK